MNSDVGSDTVESNFAAFRDCLFGPVAGSLDQSFNATGRRRKANGKVVHNRHGRGGPVLNSKPTISSDPSELAEFSDYIASEIFHCLPDDLQMLSHQALQGDADVAERWSLPLSLSTVEELAELILPSTVDSLLAYGLIEPPKSDVQSFIAPVVSAYINAVTTPPPKWITTRATACEICDRDWVPLTYHHLIPRGVHAKALKRGWHDEQVLNSVAWLCRACHTFVHKMASNEDLARDWYTVEKICSREDTQKWSQWIGRVRWKKT